MSRYDLDDDFEARVRDELRRTIVPPPGRLSVKSFSTCWILVKVPFSSVTLTLPKEVRLLICMPWMKKVLGS